jgi:uncharacterized membrane protein
MSQLKRQVIVAQYESRGEAQKALKALDKTVKTQNVELQQGAIVTRAPDGILEIQKLNDNTLRQLASDTVDLTTFVVVGSAKIVAGTVRASFGLLTSGFGRAAALAGSAAAVATNRARTFTGGDKPLRRIGGSLKPGGAAIMVVVDADHAEQVAAVLEAAKPKPSATAAEAGAEGEASSPHDLPM